MKHIHFLGIGGSGTSAAAAIAQAQGFTVTGCDLKPHNEFTRTFKDSQLFTGHNPQHLVSQSSNRNTDSDSKKVDILAVTPAIFSLDPNNSELLEAKKQGIEIMIWQQFLGKYLVKDKFVITVCGTHGKTTTTAMIAKILEDAKLDPTVELGAITPWGGTNYKIGNGKYFVVEADEFNDNFLHLKPDINVITNIEMDHPEYFENLEAVKDSFKKFLLQTKRVILANLSDSNVADILKVIMKTDICKHHKVKHDHKVKVKYLDYSKHKLNFSLKIPGTFNKLNAQAALQVGLILGIKPETIQKSLQNYQGVGKRFEYIGDCRGAKVYSDFGHHPTEIAKTMEAAREKFPNQTILLIYQPHMFARTKALFSDFVRVFQNLPVDKVFIMDIYPSREVDTGLVTSQQLIEAIQKEVESKLRSGEKTIPPVKYVGNKDQVLEKIKPEIKKGDIVFFMSAGDTDELAKKLVG
ncbi:UDP-N-acetylmuramate--L-alanine ligase [Patescibacteria group bacterium]|nr:UDP-N-acetylmuramate--L-alanine ligase [Patescibacteria group bacterium]